MSDVIAAIVPGALVICGLAAFSYGAYALSVFVTALAFYYVGYHDGRKSTFRRTEEN
jgi:hypothetical protein